MFLGKYPLVAAQPPTSDVCGSATHTNADVNAASDKRQQCAQGKEQETGHNGRGHPKPDARVKWNQGHLQCRCKKYKTASSTGDDPCSRPQDKLVLIGLSKTTEVVLIRLMQGLSKYFNRLLEAF